MKSCAVGCQKFCCYHPKTYKMSHVARSPVYGVQTMSDKNQTVQPQKIALDLKFWIYVGRENKGAAQLSFAVRGYKAADLHGYRPADLRLCFYIFKKHVFSLHGIANSEDPVQIRPLLEQPDLGLHFLHRPKCPKLIDQIYVAKNKASLLFTY